MKSGSKTASLDEALDKSGEFDERLSQEDVEALIRNSRAAQNPQAALEYAQRAVDVLPDDPKVQETVQRSVFSRLNQDAFVAFLAETDKHYVITFRNSRPVVIPKARAQPEIFPNPRRTEAEYALGMLWWVILGLVPIGIGALIMSPLTAGRAVSVLLQPGLNSREKRLACTTILLSGILGLLGMFFALLLVLHLIG